MGDDAGVGRVLEDLEPRIFARSGASTGHYTERSLCYLRNRTSSRNAIQEIDIYNGESSEKALTIKGKTP